MWFLTTGPMVIKLMILTEFLQVRELPVYLREGLLSRKNPILWHTLLPLLFVSTSPLAVITVVRLLDLLMVSNSAELRSLALLWMRPTKPTHRKANRMQLFFRLWAYGYSWQVSTRLRGRIALVFRSSNFYGVWTAHMRTFDLYLFSDGPLLSRMFAWRSAALVNRTRRVGPKTFGLFREIDTDSGGSVWHATQLSHTFHNSHCTFVITLLRPFVGLFLNLPERKWALCAEFTSRFWRKKKNWHSGCQQSQGDFAQIPFK